MPPSTLPLENRWMMAKEDLQSSGCLSGSARGPFRVYDKLSYADFLANHLLPNRPLILSSKWTADWPCLITCRSAPTHSPAASRSILGEARLPSVDAADGHTDQATPHLANLDGLRKFGDHVVPVADTSTRSFSEFERTERPLREVLDLWQNGEGEGLYVKDWHLFAEVEGGRGAVRDIYTVPDILQDDWLNPSFDLSRRSHPLVDASPGETENSSDPGDFRFCYVGPQGTFTPLHRDVYASYSWSANVVGRKMWWFFPPDNLDRVMKDGELVFDVSDLDGEGGAIKIVQEEGEVIFVPSGWHHQVVNLDFCISINHNFCSSPTLPHLFTSLCKAQNRVEESISDVRDMIRQRLGTRGTAWEEEWVEEVQGLLKRDAGWSWLEFWEMIERNVRMPPASPELSPFTMQRDRFIRDVMTEYRYLPCQRFLPQVHDIIERVQSILSSPCG